MPYKHNDPYRHKFDSIKYRVSNWREYNQALRDRDNITIWFEEKSIRQWLRSINFGNQKVEASLACKALNIMTRLGMPKTVRIS